MKTEGQRRRYHRGGRGVDICGGRGGGRACARATLLHMPPPRLTRRRRGALRRGRAARARSGSVSLRAPPCAACSRRAAWPRTPCAWPACWPLERRLPGCLMLSSSSTCTVRLLLHSPINLIRLRIMTCLSSSVRQQDPSPTVTDRDRLEARRIASDFFDARIASFCWACSRPEPVTGCRAAAAGTVQLPLRPPVSGRRVTVQVTVAAGQRCPADTVTCVPQ